VSGKAVKLRELHRLPGIAKDRRDKNTWKRIKKEKK
jgi:hypothetical protein